MPLLDIPVRDVRRGAAPKGHVVVDSISHGRGAHAASTSEELSPLWAITRLAQDPDATLAGRGDAGMVIISRSSAGEGWRLTTLARPTGLVFGSSSEAVVYATQTLGVDTFTASSTPRATQPPIATIPNPIPSTRSAPKSTPAVNPEFPLTAADAAEAIGSGRVTLIEGLGPDGRVYTLYGMNVRRSGGSALSRDVRPPWAYGSDQIGSATQDGSVVVRESVSYRVGVWAVQARGGGHDHYVTSSRDGLEDLAAHGVTAFRIPPQVR